MPATNEARRYPEPCRRWNWLGRTPAVPALRYPINHQTITPPHSYLAKSRHRRPCDGLMVAINTFPSSAPALAHFHALDCNRSIVSYVRLVRHLILDWVGFNGVHTFGSKKLAPFGSYRTQSFLSKKVLEILGKDCARLPTQVICELFVVVCIPVDS